MRSAIEAGRVGVMGVMVLMVAGCHEPKPIVPVNLFPKAVSSGASVPSYHDLVARYDANVAKLSPLWASTDVDMKWVDKDGKRQGENGDGVLIIRRPRDIALTVGKLGETGLWAGSNATRYWLFNLRQKVAYTGLYKNLGKPCTERLPVPVRPEAVPWLLGMMPIDADNVPSAPAVETFGGYFLLAPPGLHIRILLDPETAQPVRVDWLDEAGRSVLISKLSDRRPMRVAGVKRADWPTIAHKATIYAPEREARLTLELHDVSDGKAGDKIHPGVFVWSVLVKAHKPRRVIVLDQNCR